MLAPLVGGLSLFGLGEGLLVQSGWGATPWTVFAQGIVRHSSLSLGWCTALISTAVLLLWFPLKEKPGLGTITNLIIIALGLQMTVDYLPLAHAVFLRIVYILAALEAIGAGSSLYLTTGLGPGPRDGLMTSLHRRLGVSIVYVRLCLESTVLLIGWLLGGSVGIGTAVFALGIGFSIGGNLQVLSRVIERFSHD
jgi:uncharacterized protein